MKNLLLASLLAVGSMAYAVTNDRDTRAIHNLTAPEPCDVPVDCSSLSPLERSVCILKGLGQLGCTIACGAACIGAYGMWYDDKRKLSPRGKLTASGIFLAALLVGTDSLGAGAKNLSSVISG